MMPARRNQGFALILAVFLIVTLAAVGVYLVTIQTGQAAAVIQDEQAAARNSRRGPAWRSLRTGSCAIRPTAVR